MTLLDTDRPSRVASDVYVTPCRKIEREPGMSARRPKSFTVGGGQDCRLLDREVQDRLVTSLMHQKQMDRSLAERVMNEVVGFLSLVASSTDGEAYSPSRIVDMGWHAFILYTREYGAFCEKVAGRFIHHVPTDVGDSISELKGAGHTLDALRKAGFDVDEQLWLEQGDCQGHKCFGGDCTSGGPPRIVETHSTGTNV